MGSPPPMRGKGLKKFSVFPRNGITPAYAGKSRRHLKLLLETEDHPRLCGEKLGFRCRFSLIPGSPPPMRGKAALALAMLAKLRITPAYAGKSLHYRLHHCNNKDHPRLCGEKQLSQLFLCVVQGSPPPMRGKECYFVGALRSDGITPAYAGKSRFPFHHLIRSRDHPRLCGEKTKKIPKQRYFFHQPASFSFSLQYT